jgi:class 3 adenylate cyclase/CHASE2 domain-containing sensor protein
MAEHAAAPEVRRKARMRAAVIWVMVVIAGIVLHHTEWMALANGKLLDGGFIVLRKLGTKPAPNDVAVIGIDVDDLRAFSEPRDFWHPNYGRLLAVLAEAKPSVVGLDIVFPERSYQHLIPGLDQTLLQGLLAIRSAVPVVLARTVDDFNNFREIFPPFVAIAGGTDAVGSVVVCRDDDEVIRRFDEYLCDPSRTEAIATLAGTMARRIGREGTWRGYIDYQIGDAYDYVPFRNVIEWAEKDEKKLRATLGGRPVLLGFVLPFEDRKTVPVDLARWEPGNRSVPGVLVHAQVLRSMLNGGLLQPAPKWALIVLILLGSALVLRHSGRWASAGFVVFVLGVAALQLFLQRKGFVIEAAAPLLAATGAAAGRFVTDSIAHARERATLRNAFGGYVSPQVMNEILSGRLTPGMGGKRERVCILFSDVRNFTTQSEFMQPEKLIEMLNEYFTEMTRSVHDHGGTVDKFIGDGMMCFFGAPAPLANACEAASNSARDMLVRLDALNKRFAERDLNPIAIGIGLHYGEVVLGHVGSSDRHEYTAIGDAVNTASRVEGLTKGVGYAFVVTRDVYNELPEKQDFVELGEQGVKGRSAVAIYGYTPSRTRNLGDPNEQTQRVAVYGR